MSELDLPGVRYYVRYSEWLAQLHDGGGDRGGDDDSFVRLFLLSLSLDASRFHEGATCCFA